LNGEMIGSVDPAKHNLGHELIYYMERGIWLDLRGYVDIHPQTEFGFGVKIITATHNSDWMFKEGKGRSIQYRTVKVGKQVWVCSFAVLFNCVVEQGAIVGCGAVVCNMTVPEYSMVVGNPARVVKRYVGGEWVRGE
jgi:acetyltransferase-like isoleucine patch superfamily enzyme